MEPPGSREAGQSEIASVLSINVGLSRPLDVGAASRGMSVESGIVKRTVSSVVEPSLTELGRLGFVGDEQADLTVHGGLDKAVYLYPFEHYGWWKHKRAEAGVADADEPLPFGFLGENLTTNGLMENHLWIGDRLVIGDIELRVEAPRNPCFKLNAVMGYRSAARHMLLSGRAGVYLSVVKSGVVSAGMLIRIVPGRREESIIDLLAWRRSRAQREP